MRAVIQKSPMKVEVADRDRPKVGPKDILVKNVALGLNPTDWKHSKFMSPENAIMGCDCTGTVEEIGSEVPKDFTQKGDRRGIHLRGSMYPENGAFAEYTRMPYDLTFRLPQAWSFEEGATAPCPALTACQALYLRLKIPHPGQSTSSKQWLLVYSASSAVGQYAVQLATASGLQVIATCSKERFDLIKGLGAKVCLDYKDSDLVAKIKEATDDSVEYAFDTYGMDGSAKKCHDALSSQKGGKLVNIVTQDPKDFPRKDVEQITTIVYTGVGESLTSGGWNCPSSDEDVASHAYFCREFPNYVEKYDIKPLPIKKLEGLDKVQEGLDELAQGVSATKIIVTV